MKYFESLYSVNSRNKEIEQILTFIKEGTSCQTVSLPGGGRSNLLELLSYNKAIRTKHLGENQKSFHFVLLNFSEVRNKPLTDAIKFLLLSLIDSLRDRRMDEEVKTLKEIFDANAISNDELILFHGLKRAIEYLALEKNLTVVLLFDRFEEYIPMLTSEFFTNLRILRNLAKYRFSVVFSLNRPLEDLIDYATLADFYDFIAGHIVYLDLFDKLGIDFRIAYIEKASDKKVHKKVLEAIFALTGGHGKLTRLCVEAILAFSYQRLGSSSQFEKFLLEQKPIQGALLEIWNSLTPAEQNILATKRHSGQARMTDEDYFYLQNVGLFKKNKTTIKIIDAFIKQKPQHQITTQNITFDLNTNEVKKGSLLLSDKLTSFEFNLLKFLLQNSNRILEREEIISAVWKDEKSTAGVTDQALDQLIFRVRRKIESDPNNPMHLQTVKGRGFRFVP